MIRSFEFNPDSPYTLGGITVFLNSRIIVNDMVFYPTDRIVRGIPFICPKYLLKDTLKMAVDMGCGGYRYTCK